MELIPAAKNTLTLMLDATLDATASHPFRQLVRQALEDKPSYLALDFSRLTCIDSTGLGLLTLPRPEAERAGIELGGIAADRPPSLELADALEYRRWSETDDPGDLRIRHPAVRLEEAEDLKVDRV